MTTYQICPHWPEGRGRPVWEVRRAEFRSGVGWLYPFVSVHATQAEAQREAARLEWSGEESEPIVDPS